MSARSPARPADAALDRDAFALALDEHTLQRLSWHDDPGGCNLDDCAERIAAIYDRIMAVRAQPPTPAQEEGA